MKHHIAVFYFACTIMLTSAYLLSDVPQDQKDKQDRVINQQRSAPDQPRRAVEQQRKAPDQPRRAVEQQRKAPDQPRKAVEQLRKAPDQPRRAVEQQRKAADQPRKAVEQLRKAPDQPKRNSEQRQKQQDSRRQSPFTPRSPSLSRPANRPERTHTGTGAPTRSRDSIKQQAQQFSDRRGRPQAQTQENERKADELRSSFRERSQSNRKTARNVTSHVGRNHPGYHRWFNNDFYREHNYYPSYWRNDIDWWRGSHWRRVHGWLGWTSTVYPLYYYYGYPVKIEAYDEGYNEPSYSEEAFNGDWMPLGVFAIGADASQAANATIFIQLAINQQGDLAGTYYNSSTNQSYPIEGTVDRETQQAYWRQSDEITAPVITTGLYNLTQDVVDVQLTFPSGIVQNWSMVRLEEQP